MFNAETLPSPDAKWNRSDSSANSKRRDGKWTESTVYAMLRNELYRGESIWNRAEFYLYTGPDTGKTTRKQNPRPPEEWMRQHDEKLRIVPEGIWDRCQKRMQETSSRTTRQKSRADRRRLRLLDLMCTECDGRYVMVNWKQLGCSTNRNGGETACSNSQRLNVAEANQALIDAVCDPEDGLLSDATLRKVRKHAHMQKLKREAAKETGAAQRLREQVEENARQQENVIDLVAAHGRTAALDKKL